jgi:hypothetical protein
MNGLAGYFNLSITHLMDANLHMWHEHSSWGYDVTGLESNTRTTQIRFDSHAGVSLGHGTKSEIPNSFLLFGVCYHDHLFATGLLFWVHGRQHFVGEMRSR